MSVPDKKTLKSLQPSVSWLVDRLLRGNPEWVFNPEKDKNNEYPYDVIMHPQDDSLLLKIEDKHEIKVNNHEIKNILFALAHEYKENSENLCHVASENRHLKQQVNDLLNPAPILEDDEIHGLMREWHNDARMHSFPHTIMDGEAFNELRRVEPKRMIPILLEYLRDVSPWMGYQGFLTRLAGEDFGKWESRCDGLIKAYNVNQSALSWLEWGKSAGYINNINVKWKKKERSERDLCYECGKEKVKWERVDINDKTYKVTDFCTKCGILRVTEVTNVDDGEWDTKIERPWRERAAKKRHQPKSIDNSYSIQQFCVIDHKKYPDIFEDIIEGDPNTLQGAQIQFFLNTKNGKQPIRNSDWIFRRKNGESFVVPDTVFLTMRELFEPQKIKPN